MEISGNLIITSNPKPKILRGRVGRQWLKEVCIPSDFWSSKTLLDYSGYSDELKATIRDYINNMPENAAGGLGILAYGSYAVGKTSLGCIVLKEAMIRGGEVYFIRAARLIKILKRFTPPKGEENIEDVLHKVNILMVDDIKEEHSNGKDGLLEQVIRERGETSGKATILTTNMTSKQLGSNEFFASFLKRDSKYLRLHVTGPDARGKPPQDAANARGKSPQDATNA